MGELMPVFGIDLTSPACGKRGFLSTRTVKVVCLKDHGLSPGSCDTTSGG